MAKNTVNKMTFAFIYTKDSQVQCFDIDQAKQDGDKLIADGWKHVSTVNPIIILQILLNTSNQDRIISFLDELKTLNKQ